MVLSSTLVSAAAASLPPPPFLHLCKLVVLLVFDMYWRRKTTFHGFELQLHGDSMDGSALPAAGVLSIDNASVLLTPPRSVASSMGRDLHHGCATCWPVVALHNVAAGPIDASGGETTRTARASLGPAWQDNDMPPPPLPAPLKSEDDDSASVQPLSSSQCDEMQLEFMEDCPLTFRRMANHADPACKAQLARLRACFEATAGLGIGGPPDTAAALKPANPAVTDYLALTQARHGVFLLPRLDLFIGASLRACAFAKHGSFHPRCK